MCHWLVHEAHSQHTTGSSAPRVVGGVFVQFECDQSAFGMILKASCNAVHSRGVIARSVALNCLFLPLLGNYGKVHRSLGTQSGST